MSKLKYFRIWVKRGQVAPPNFPFKINPHIGYMGVDGEGNMVRSMLIHPDGTCWSGDAKSEGVKSLSIELVQGVENLSSEFEVVSECDKEEFDAHWDLFVNSANKFTA